MAVSERLLTEREHEYLVDILQMSGYIIWAGLIDRGYPHDPEERHRAHHLWNTMPAEKRPRWYHFLRYKPV